MPQIAGFRGTLWDTKVELAKVAVAAVAKPKEALEKGELVRDTTRAMYRYHQSFAAGPRTLVRKSFFAAIALAPWTDGSVRPHEATDAKTRDAALAGIAGSRIQTEAVIAGYRDAPNEVERIFRGTDGARPIVDITTPDGTNHKLFRVQSAEIIGKLRPLFAPKKLHVLDGHAQYEAMVAYRDQLAAKAPLPQYSSANYALACLVNLDDPALAVGARHRILRGANVTREQAFEKAKPYFIVEKLAGAAKDTAKHFAALADTVAHQPAFIAIFPGDADAWKLTLSPDISPVNEGVSVSRDVQKFDPVVVEYLFLGKIAPGVRPETTIDPAAVIAAVDNGADLAIIMRPLTVAQITRADELQALLPSGSTAFHPPIARLVGYVVDPDEDLV